LSEEQLKRKKGGYYAAESLALSLFSSQLTCLIDITEAETVASIKK